MDNEEAKFILKAYRPSGADAKNARFGAALNQAERDPALKTWFEREQARDKAIAVKLQSIRIPTGLRESILTGGKLSAARRSWWQQPAWIAMAASIAILLTLALTWRYRSVRIDWNQVVAQISNDAAHGELHGSHGEAANQLVAMLSSSATHLSAPMNIDLGKLKTDGCRTLSVAGHEVMEVCFVRSGAEFHLYVMKRPVARDLPRAPQFATNADIHSVLWTDADHLYVMASTKDESALKALL